MRHAKETDWKVTEWGDCVGLGSKPRALADTEHSSYWVQFNIHSGALPCPIQAMVMCPFIIYLCRYLKQISGDQ